MTIPAIITLIGQARKIYDTAQNNNRLPEGLQEVADQLAVAENILQELAAKRQSDVVSSEVGKMTDTCFQKVKELRDLLQELTIGEEAKRGERYIKATKAVGKQGKADGLMEDIMVQLKLLRVKLQLENERKMVTQERNQERISRDLTRKPVSQDKVTGGGSMYIHQGRGGAINNGPGAGRTFNGPVKFGSKGMEEL